MKRRVVPLLALLFGLGLAALALPRMIAGVNLVPAMPVLEALRGGEPVTDPYLDAAEDAALASLAWSAEAQTWADLGLVQWEQARRAGLTSAAATARLAASALAQDRALALAPSLGLVWARRAQIELARNGLTNAFERSLVLSLATARFDPTVLWSRLDLGLIAWPVLAPETRALLTPQVAAAATVDADRLAVLALRRFAFGPVRRILADTPDRLADFERALARLR